MVSRLRPNDGMTMVEVLVVIAIAAVLTAMVVPIFSTIRFRQHMGACASNLKTIGQALLMYRSDYLAFPPDHSEWSAALQMYDLGLSQLYYAYWANQTDVVRPDGDADVNWSATGSPHYAQINEQAQAPTQGGPANAGGADTADAVSADAAQNGAVESFDMQTRSGVAAVTQVDVWAYCRADGAGDASVDIYLPSTGWQPLQELNAGGGWEWRQVRWVGSWTQADLDQLRVRFTALTPASGNTVQIAALYALVSWSKLPRVLPPANYITEARVLHCPRAPTDSLDQQKMSADREDLGDPNSPPYWPYLGGYNVYDWNYLRNRSDIWPEQGARNLTQPFPPDDTVVTWCPMHRDNAPRTAHELGDVNSRDWDLVLWADGSVGRMAARFDQYKAEQPR
jgi:prepilin-type N-terminal cleavage/methylation domain-containing protein